YRSTLANWMSSSLASRSHTAGAGASMHTNAPQPQHLPCSFVEELEPSVRCSARKSFERARHGLQHIVSALDLIPRLERLGRSVADPHLAAVILPDEHLHRQVHGNLAGGPPIRPPHPRTAPHPEHPPPP